VSAKRTVNAVSPNGSMGAPKRDARQRTKWPHFQPSATRIQSEMANHLPDFRFNSKITPNTEATSKQPNVDEKRRAKKLLKLFCSSEGTFTEQLFPLPTCNQNCLGAVQLAPVCVHQELHTVCRVQSAIGPIAPNCQASIVHFRPRRERRKEKKRKERRGANLLTGAHCVHNLAQRRQSATHNSVWLLCGHFSLAEMEPVRSFEWRKIKPEIGLQLSWPIGARKHLAPCFFLPTGRSSIIRPSGRPERQSLTVAEQLRGKVHLGLHFGATLSFYSNFFPPIFSQILPQEKLQLCNSG